MFVWLARAIALRPWGVPIGAALALMAALLVGRGLSGRLSYAVSADPATESARGAALAQRTFGEGDPDIVALYRLPPGVARASGVQDPAVRKALARALAGVTADPSVERVLSELSLGGARFVSKDRRSTFVVLSLRGAPRDRAAALPRLERSLAVELHQHGRTLRLQPLVGGLVPSGRSLTQLARQALVRGERFALPLTGVLLLVIFGSLVAALLPLVIGGVSIVLALGILTLLARVTPIDAFAINVVTILGLGAAIDYALFVVTRYREELANGDRADPQLHERALERTLATAGRSVLFAGATVVTSLAGLLVLHQPLLRSVALGGMAVVLMAATLALVLLPSLLALFGRHLERGRLPWRAPAGDRNGENEVRWRRFARAVIAHRVAVCTSVALLLLMLAAPFLRLQPSRSDVRALPPDSEPRRAVDSLARAFPAVSLTPINVIVTMPDPISDEEQLAALYDYEQRLRRLPAVKHVESLLQFTGVHDRDAAMRLSALVERVEMERTSARAHALASIVNGRRTLVRVISSAPPDSRAGQQLIRALRATAPPPGASVLVYGQAASLRDFADDLAHRAPLMLLLVGLAMFAVLYVAFHSVLLPLKAMVMTALSLTASFGAIVFVFQDGRLQRLLDYHALGTIDASLPVVMFAVVFGLSMDYEVIILTRIREAWLRTGDNRGAIVEGVAQTGRVITGAAAVMIVVFSAFTVAPLIFVKAIGVGTALAIALDATVVRLLLVPSTMALLGRLNWWTPKRFAQ